MGFVLDASIALSWGFSDEKTPFADRLLERLDTETALVPTIWPLEIGNILILSERRKRISYASMIQFLTLLGHLRIEVDNETSTRAFHEITSLAYSEKLTSYDAAYLELAMRRGIPLATKDSELSRVAKQLGISVICE